jgi:hypothetical protein
MLDYDEDEPCPINDRNYRNYFYLYYFYKIFILLSDSLITKILEMIKTMLEMNN